MAGTYRAVHVEWYVWAGFVGFVVLMLGLDLFVFRRRPDDVSLREALVWSGVWIGVSLLFAGVLLWWQGWSVTQEFLAAYLIEKSLSIDNIFLFAVIFSSFSVPEPYQVRVLLWGVLGAIVLRGSFVLGGFALMKTFHVAVYAFGAMLLVVAIQTLRRGERRVEPGRHPVLRALRRVVPMTEDFRGQHLLTREKGKLMATPLLAVLVLIEASDVAVAIDSVPAIFSVTRSEFVAFTSIVLALLGMRALYFAVEDLVERLRYLRQTLAAILAVVGLKLLLTDVVEIPPWVSLLVIAGLLAVGVAASLLGRQREARGAPAGRTADGEGG